MWQRLRERIRAGDPAGVVAVVEPLAEAQRKELRAPVGDELNALSGQQQAAFIQRQQKGWDELNLLVAEDGLEHHEAQRVLADRRRGEPREHDPHEAPLEAAELARFGVSTPRDLGWRFQFCREGHYERLARSRSGRWRQTVADEIALPIGWIVQMARDGLVERPASDAFVTATIADESVVGDPQWRETEVWRYFELESAAEVLSSYRLETWTALVCASARAGDLRRGRLLDAALAGLRRDFAFKNTRWYRALYVALEPTPAEHAQRAGDLIALLGSDDKLNVGFALDGLTAAAADVPAHDLLESLEPALAHPVQKHATSAVRLVGLVLEAHPEAARAGAGALVGALVHDRRAVQSAALKLLEGHAGALRDADRDRMSAHAGVIDPALRARVLALSGSAADVAVAPASAPPVPPATAPDRLAPRLREEDLLEPIATPVALLDRALDALQGEPDADEIELVIDAIFRLVDQPVDAERVEGLLAWHRVSDPGREAASEVLRSVLHAQLHRDSGTSAGRAWGRPALSLRLAELLYPIKTPRQLMSIPTHRGGWIDPRTAVARFAAATERPWRVDFAQMLLRLAPDHRREALAAAEALPDRAGAFLIHALGGPAATLADFRGDRMLLDAAQRAREPERPVGTWHPHAGPHRLNDHARDWALTRELPPACPAGLFEHREDRAPLLRGTAQQLLRVWPCNRESCYRMVALRLWLGHDPDHPDDGLPPILATLLDPAEPVGPFAALAIAFSFSADDPLLRALAVDVAIAVLSDRRCDGDVLGGALARILRDRRPVAHQVFDWNPPRDVKLTRWAEPLARIADAGPLHAHDVQTVLERVLAAAGDGDRRALAGCVDLLRRLALAADAAVSDDGARGWLGRYSPKTAGGRAARELLALGGTGAARRHAAVAGLGSRR